jgi:hypothetical protein
MRVSVCLSVSLSVWLALRTAVSISQDGMSSRHYMWASHEQDLTLLKAVREHEPWNKRYGKVNSTWDAIAKLIPPSNAVDCKGRAAKSRFEVLQNWFQNKCAEELRR